jgi:hypothetical protein
MSIANKRVSHTPAKKTIKNEKKGNHLEEGEVICPKYCAVTAESFKAAANAIR